MKKLLNNTFFKILIVLFATVYTGGSVFAIGDNQVTRVPLNNSYSEAVQYAQNNNALGSQKIKTTENTSTAAKTQSEDKESTLAHRAVNGTIEQATQDALNNTTTPEVNSIKKEIQKQTKPKRSFVNLIFKFILALIWVAISSVIIFIILLSYKKLILKGKPIAPTYESMEQSLDTPKNFKEALKLFLDKTKWN